MSKNNSVLMAANPHAPAPHNKPHKETVWCRYSSDGGRTEGYGCVPAKREKKEAMSNDEIAEKIIAYERDSNYAVSWESIKTGIVDALDAKDAYLNGG